MRTDPPLSLDDLLKDEGAEPGPDHDAWARAKIERALEGMKDQTTLVPAEQVWRELGLET